MTWVLAALVLQEGRFFDRRDVDFFGTRKKPEPARSWVEPVQGADGRWQLYVPPREVIAFLESPTRETGERYLAWQRDRMDRLRKAVAVLQELQPKVLYFSKPDCPYCEAQEKELAGMRVVRVEADSPLWKKVRVVPTLMIGDRILEGFTPRAAIEREVRRVGR
jgi:hypothetical protein